jgi:hypothetical protein
MTKFLHKLSGWQRKGIIISALWTVVAAIYKRSADLAYAKSMASQTLSSCLEFQIRYSLSQNSLNCSQMESATYSKLLENSWNDVARLAFGPFF